MGRPPPQVLSDSSSLLDACQEALRTQAGLDRVKTAVDAGLKQLLQAPVDRSAAARKANRSRPAAIEDQKASE